MHIHYIAYDSNMVRVMRVYDQSSKEAEEAVMKSKTLRFAVPLRALHIKAFVFNILVQ